MELEDIIVIDNFYSEPFKVRDIALRSEYYSFDKIQKFPGTESKKSFFSNNHIQRFEKLLNRKIEVDPNKYIFGKFRFATKNDQSKTHVHLDSAVDWTGIVYLSLNSDCKGGLGIYKNKKTGLIEIPKSKEEFLKYGCATDLEFDQKYILPVTSNENAWELQTEYKIKFNRLILFKGSRYFHAITKQFGDNIENSRLTQNFFFKEVK
ncbi:DUF6445 family protein [Cytobacillus horneckiae]|uniref:DUF6445 family protein n=1 Tax=Cytobacillus horneckiae TaxID=549687 RepID=UPI0039A14AA1